MRIDKWLWVARFYRTRSKAKDAVAGGRVHVNGNRVKPSHDVRVGDALEVNRSVTKEDIEITGLSERRGNASTAQTLYVESHASIDRRQEAVSERKLQRAGLQAPKLKPSKQARRKLLELKSNS